VDENRSPMRHSFRDERIRTSAKRARQLNRPPKQRVCLWEQGELTVDHTENVEKLSVNFGLIPQCGVDSFRAAVQEISRGDITPVDFAGISSFEESNEKVLHFRCLRRFGGSDCGLA